VEVIDFTAVLTVSIVFLQDAMHSANIVTHVAAVVGWLLVGWLCRRMAGKQLDTLSYNMELHLSQCILCLDGGWATPIIRVLIMIPTVLNLK